MCPTPRNTRHVVVLLLAVSLSTAYLVRAINKVGIWAGVVFVLIWVPTFLYKILRSRKP
jgi:hypothetical protein